jgi:hypothetical protein
MVVAAVMVGSVVVGAIMVVPAVMVGSVVVGRAAMVVPAVMLGSVVVGATMVVPAVMVGSGVIARAAMAVVSVSWRVMPRVVMMMRRLRVPVPWRVMPRVMVVRVQPVVIVMTPPGLDGMDAAVVETPGVPLAHAVPSRQRRLRGQAA